MFSVFRTLAATALLFSVYASAEPAHSLEGAYAVEGPPALEPSGLVLCDGRLLFVSDNHDDTVFELLLSGDAIASAVPYRRIENIPPPPQQAFTWSLRLKRFMAELVGLSGGMDWEGITCDATGTLYLASEYYFAVLAIDPENNLRWLGSDLYAFGRERGLFETMNAYLEGITLHQDEWVLAVEREPRALIQMLSGEPVAASQPTRAGVDGEGLSYDYTGLTVWENRLFVLSRNHYDVCELDPLDFKELACFNYRDVERSAAYGYDTGPYGLGEGLSITDEAIWILLDNNGQFRLNNAKDGRPQLFRFDNPF